MHLQSVSDARDPLLDDYRSLTDAALRRVQEPEGGLYIAESAKVIERALAAGHRPRSVLTQQKWVDAVAPLFGAHDVPVYVVSDAVAEQLTGFAVHRGVMAAMHRPEMPSLSDVVADARRVLVLEDIADPTNIGAAFRAAAGLGADAVLVTPRCGDPLYRRSVRVSMGTVFQVPWTRIGEWSAAGPQLHAHGFEIAALALSDDAVALDAYAASSPERVALVMGTEGEGLSRGALDAADRIVTIPMAGGVDSLNVASAAAVAVWALTR
ncbi:RNA methyltransferase [Microbacterium sp. H1-D42]|uniref:TrmH family RNA methyltransferase n=1 Tax=Microbacterium sp. H1-D42 TaxID=2925844 RepID=UPI001F52B97A|nr:RNA methyltransferase [Microbacterium sp. H1-D42]UNK69324.1 RNA methyltransferase [Microbacterium sp. H1-D42]